MGGCAATRPPIRRGLLFLRLEDVRRDDHNGGVPLVFLPMRSFLTRRQQLTGMMIARCTAVAVLRQRPLRDVGDTRSVLMGMETNHAARIQFEHAKPKLPPL